MNAHGLRQLAHGACVARPMQSVEHAIGAGLGEQAGHPVGVLARVLNLFVEHGGHGAPSSWPLSSESGSENSSEGGR